MDGLDQDDPAMGGFSFPSQNLEQNVPRTDWDCKSYHMKRWILLYPQNQQLFIFAFIRIHSRLNILIKSAPRGRIALPSA